MEKYAIFTRNNEQFLFKTSLYFTCVAIFAHLSSYYYQTAMNIPFRKEVSIYSVLIGFIIFTFMFLISWNFPSAIIAGVLGGIIFTHRAT